MDAVTAYNARSIETAQEFSTAMFTDFVKYIDRTSKTTRSYLTNLKQFAAWLKYAGVSEPVRDDIIAYRDWLTVEHDAIALDNTSSTGWSYRTNAQGEPIKIMCKPNTVAQYLRSVKQFFKWTGTSGLYPDIASNIHAPRIKNAEHRKDALTIDEVQTIEASITERAQVKTQTAQESRKDTDGKIQRSTEQGKRLYAMYLLAVNAGLRTIEISRANVKDFITKGNQSWLYIWGKGHSEPDQKKPIAKEVAQAVNEYLQSRTDRVTGASPLFVATGNRSGGKRIASTTIGKMLKSAMVNAGYNSDRLTAHSLRHTAGTAVMELTGNNIYTSQHYMRHANPATTEIYLHNDTDKQEATIAQELYNLYHGEQSDQRAKLEQLIGKLTPAKLEQLTNIAAAMA